MTASFTPRTHQARAPRIAGLLLAGGRGSRFDPSGKADKLLAPWLGRPIAAWSASLLRSACDPCFAILPPGKEALRKTLENEGLLTIVDEKVREGMGASLAAGVQTVVARCQPDAIVVALADMPTIQSSTVSTLLEAWQADEGRHLAAAPFFEGKRGHPVVFGRPLFPRLAALSGERGAGAIIEALQILVVDINDPGVLRDVDTVDDLARVDQSPDCPA